MSPNDELTIEKVSAVHNLTGVLLDNGWVVGQKHEPAPLVTPGHFSVCYLVEKDGLQGFLKAINPLRLFDGSNEDALQVMQRTLEIFNYEVAICEQCNGKNMTRVSKLIEHGMQRVSGFMFTDVHYLIFEKADGDSRDHAVFARTIEIAWKLRSLHNVATGMKQLHSIEVSHQDLKPSNIFVFDGTVSKIGDLGRALSRTLEAEHSKLQFSGDMRFAPPEVAFRFILPDWKQRVFAVDCYLLGSMIPYYFMGTNATSLLYDSLGPDIDVSPARMSFHDALPYLVNAFASADDTLCKALKSSGMDAASANDLVGVYRFLCHPDPEERGHPKTKRELGHPLLIQRFETIFNRLAWTYEHRIKHGESIH